MRGNDKQMLQHFMLEGILASADIGTHGNPGINLLKTPRDDCIMQHRESMFQMLLLALGKEHSKEQRKVLLRGDVVLERDGYLLALHSKSNSDERR